MKSEFHLALNQICSERNLPREIITQVLETALVQSYRKNASVMTSQNVAAKVDIESGDMRIYVEKEVVDAVMDDRTEVSLEEARQNQDTAELGDCILVDVTLKDFGRIAAQNAKQMIVQKLREAEKDFQYNQFAEREGEIVNGLVQSASPAGVVLNLGRVEGVLSKKDMIPGEKYDLQQRVRAYVVEVRRTPRGPQIMLSRTNKNMLRRLLEIEVPEIQKAVVEIKAIAREPGSRSKVAVAAKQPNVDPVGACVGQRGTRIQNIVGELHNEKIDVIEWNEDPVSFITKALSPARVMSVYISPSDKEAKNAIVIVPDDQLSLAIGREGQNARLAARLTGWHIDIKSSNEALRDGLSKLGEDPALRAAAGADVAQTAPMLKELIVRQNAMITPLSAEEFAGVKKLVDSVFAYEAFGGGARARAAVEALSDAMAQERREARQAAIAAIPKPAYNMSVESLELSPRVTQHIIGGGVTSVGQLLEFRVRGDEGLLSIEGIGPKALSEIKQALDKVIGQFALAVPSPELAPEIEPEAPPKPEALVAPVAKPAPVQDEEDTRTPEEIFMEAMSEDEDGDEEELDETGKPVPGKKKDKKKGIVKKGKGPVLIYDEELGRMVPQRARKGRPGEFFDEAE